MEARPVAKEAYQLLHDGVMAFCDMEQNGIRIDVGLLEKTIAKVGKRIEVHTAELKADPIWSRWKKRYGDSVNLGSRPQLSTILRDVLGFESEKKTRTGRDRMDAGSLAQIDSPFVKRLIWVEKLKKTRGTFLKGIQREVVDGLLHPSFNLHLARTYRSSSDNPNFQNFPIRDPVLGKLIRSCFIPRKDHVLVEADFSSLEVRISACYNKDPVLIQYIEDPTRDMHRDMACECFKLPQEEVTKQIRFYAKNQFVFPEFYGSYYIQCAPQLWESAGKLETASGVPLLEHLADHGISWLGYCDSGQSPKSNSFEKHIREVENDFWGRRFRVYAQWKKDWFEQYQKTGSFRLLTGFVVDGVHKKNDVINYPVQGAAFHCLLWSLIQLNSWLKLKKMLSKIVGQIHDSIIADVHKSELNDFLLMVKQITTQDIRKAWKWIIVPLEIELEVGEKNWYEKREVKI